MSIEDEIYERIPSLTYDEYENCCKIAKFIEEESNKIDLDIFVECSSCVQKLIEEIRLTILEYIDGKKIIHEMNYTRLFSVKYASCKIRNYFNKIEIEEKEKHKYNSICLNLFRKIYEKTYYLNVNKEGCSFIPFMYSSFILKLVTQFKEN